MAGSAAADSVAEKVNYGRIIEELTAIKKYQDSILRIQDSIYRIQDSTYQQRMRAYEVRAEARAVEELETSPSEYAVLSGIKGNTDFKFLEDSWSLYGIIATILALLSVVYAGITYSAQKNTEKHTKNAPVSAQKYKLADLPRHFYRNIVCTCAIIFKYIHTENIYNGKRQKYPSESNLLKLQTLPDDIFLPIDITDEESYSKMHELKLLFRNYNTEIAVASDHLSRQHITDDSLEQDFDNLLFKPFHLTRETFSYEEILGVDKSTQNERAVKNIVEKHLEKLMRLDNISILMIERNNGYLMQLLCPGFSYIKKDIDIKGGSLERSLGAFAGVSIRRKEFIAGIRYKSVRQFIQEATKDNNGFQKWFEANSAGQENKKHTDATLSADKLYESLKPYLEYLSRGTWNFGELFYYMLAVDIAIETDRIGMINY